MRPTIYGIFGTSNFKINLVPSSTEATSLTLPVPPMSWPKWEYSDVLGSIIHNLQPLGLAFYISALLNKCSFARSLSAGLVSAAPENSASFLPPVFFYINYHCCCVSFQP